MWHNAREVGCGVYYCKGINQTLANCVYDKPYDWGAKVYQPGTPCSGKGCASCDRKMALCELA
ncbi:hypothetical protein AAVH_19713 [Aphelenchoides avenae]|nr:hypothetical protein AAVH_19713 [Aphelenchus avenae]